jgi:hypothetical protein
MNQSHTPGPWHFRDGSGLVRDDHKNVIADVWQDYGSDTSRANLRLVTAAPDLLAALRFIANDCPIKQHADIARAAIEKAEGQQ